jgi:hypothetical protein
MKWTPLFRALLPALAMALGVALPALADTATNAAAAKPPPSALDNDEMVELKKAREQVLAANPDLKAEEEKLKALHEAQGQNPPTDAQKNAAYDEWKAYQKKIRAAMLKVDPSLSAIFAKLDEARKHGSPPPFAPAAK